MHKIASAGKYVAYPEYKDSEVETIRDIPIHWKTASVSKLFSIKAGGDVKTDIFSENKNEKHPYPIYTNANDEKAIYGYTSKSYYLPNTITVSGRGEVGFAAYRDHAYDAIIRLLVLTPMSESNGKFFTYFINGVIEFRVQSSAIGQLSTQQLAPYKVAFPPYEEQEKIANFLDHETAKIDTLIEKQQQLIKLLKEKRQAVISHAVTKGLNPDAAMKDSGVEWLGEVPEHWKVNRLKNISDVIDCRNKTPEYFDNGEYFVVRTTNIKNQTLNMNGALYTNKANFKIWTQRGIPPSGSIFFTREAPAGEVCLVPENMKFCMGQRMMNFICHNPKYTSYLFDFLLSDCLERYVESVSHGSTVSHLRVEQVENIPVIVPPLNEADEIHKELALIKTKYLKLTASAESAIELMKERRTALISAAVTGKIDVRHWQAPATSISKGVLSD
jgi:type I restriction enzyme S subunit